MRDFDEVVAANVADRESSVGEPSDEFRARTWRGVRRRRARRHAYESVAVVGVVAVVVGLGWVGASRGEPHPAPPAPTSTPSVSPTPSASATPSATPSPTPSPTSSAPPAPLPTLKAPPSSVGPVRAMPKGLLEKSERGWLLSVYEGDFDSGAPGAIVVTDLDRNRYHVLDLPAKADITVHAWEPGSTRVLVSQSRRAEHAAVPRGYLDLTTGVITPDARGLLAGREDEDVATSYVGLDADGRELWVEYEVSGDGSGAGRLVALTDDEPVELAQLGYGWSTPQVDPTGRRAVVGAGSQWSDHYLSIDLVDGTSREVPYGVAGQGCQVVGWLDASSLLTSCQDEGRGTEYGMHRWGAPDADFDLYRLPVTGSTAPLPLAHPAGAPLPLPGSGAWLDESAMVLTAVDPEAHEVGYLWEDGSWTELVPSRGLSAVGSGTVYVRISEEVRPVSARLGLGLDLRGEPPADTPWSQSWVVAGGPWSR